MDITIVFSHNNMQLTRLQYDAIMAAIDAERSYLTIEGIDPYAEKPYPEYTNENLLKALDEVENLLSENYLKNK